MSGIISYLTFFQTIYTEISFRQKKSNFYHCHILLCFYSHFPITLGTLVVLYIIATYAPTFFGYIISILASVTLDHNNILEVQNHRK